MQGSSQSVQSQIQNEKRVVLPRGGLSTVVGATRGTSSTSVGRTRVAAAVERWRTQEEKLRQGHCEPNAWGSGLGFRV